jgi:hypothetical protein
MTCTQSPAVALAERLCRPQRIGVFGHRGVGKTTLLTMLYREAVGGRLPGLRLAAADARTADYLSDKVLQLEAGAPLPATLGETELRFHLYHQGARLELVVMDYQGEHVALGREEPIRDFLRQCDAVWLCLDVPVTAAPAPCLQAQQEVEQLVEDYLGSEDPRVPHRPMALVLTKSDLLGLPAPEGGAAVAAAALKALVDRHFGMTRHALESHCPWHGLFAVSSLGAPLTAPAPEPAAAFRPRPAGLHGPLTWLAEALRAQDEARLERLWELAPGQLLLLERAGAAFARRHPDAPATAAFRRRLAQARARTWRRRALAAAAAVAAVFLSVWGYDAHGHYQAWRFAELHADDPAAVRTHWRSYQAWHPTRNLLRPVAARAEEERLEALERDLYERERAERLRDLRRLAADPDADPEAVAARLRRFQADFPEYDADSEWEQFQARVRARRDAHVAERARAAKAERQRKAELAFFELQRAEAQSDLPALIGQANRWLREHDGTPRQAEVDRRRTTYLQRLDDRDFDAARDYSTRYPVNFFTRRERYQNYLNRHPQGAHAKEARAALARVAADWDRHDFRAVRDHFQGRPGDVLELKKLGRRYLDAHPDGRFTASARELLRWADRVLTTQEYRVVLKSGSFDKSVAHRVSRGASLSVEIEVNGVRYGPSNIVKRTYTPEWDYEFPRKVRWKLGDAVRIYVTDHYYWRRKVAELGSEEGDPLAMRLLSGEVASGTHRLTFQSDFAMPVLPKVD